MKRRYIYKFDIDLRRRPQKKDNKVNRESVVSTVIYWATYNALEPVYKKPSLMESSISHVHCFSILS